MNEATIGIIGGSGLYQMEGLTVLDERKVETPFGDPSDAYIVGEIDGVRVAFLSRHGRGHRLSPSELNYRANIFGMKLLGVEYILSASAVGSLQERYVPQHLVFFEHDPAIAAGYIRETNGKKHVEAVAT